MRFSIVFWLFVSLQTVVAQDINRGLDAYFSFDSYPFTDRSGNTNRMIIGGDSTIACGINGSNAYQMDGLRSEAFFIGPAISDNFKAGAFSVSFYMKPYNQGGTATLDILSKRKNCDSDSSFAIRYTPLANQISVEVSENTRFRHNIVARLDFNRCWQHIVVIRDFNKLSLYVNGRLAAVNTTVRRVNITNDAPLALAKSPCLGTTDRKFGGFIDELRIYNRALTEADVAALYVAPDRIATKDTIIFLGNSVPTNITRTCATRFEWSPSADVSEPDTYNPVITPTAGGTFRYRLKMEETHCTSLDTLEIKVIDPKDLSCETIFLPKAFSPNGDGLNETFFISNPYAIENVSAFEINDAWGGRIFYTEDKFSAWDGTFNGKTLNPGVFMWKVKYKCKGEEKMAIGSVTLLR